MECKSAKNFEFELKCVGFRLTIWNVNDKATITISGDKNVLD